MSEAVRRRDLLRTAGVTAGLGITASSLVSCSESENSKKNASAGGAGTAAQEKDAPMTTLADAIVAFDGEHQAGIETPSQAQLSMVGFDLKSDITIDGLRNLMALWTEDARNLCTAEAPLGSLEPELVEIPANLTITCGWGEGVFKLLGDKSLKPGWLEPIKKFKRDKLDEEWGQTDLVLQICCDDPAMAAHAMRHMVRASANYADVSWVQQGFNNAHGSLEKGATPRNLFGQKDGTVNPREPEDYADQVWIEDSSLGNDDGHDWMAGSTAMVIRRIRMNLDTWEQLDRTSRENAIGRTLDTGAPLNNPDGDEFEAVDPGATDKFGLPMVDPKSHVARARPVKGHPEQMLRRRPFNYSLPPNPKDNADGQLSNVGLIFVCFQKDPKKQFEAIQERLDEADILNTWITHIGSSVYWVPPGTAASASQGRDTYWGQSVLEAVT